FVHAQHLRVDPAQLRGDRDRVDGVVGVHVVHDGPPSEVDPAPGTGPCGGRTRTGPATSQATSRRPGPVEGGTALPGVVSSTTARSRCSTRSEAFCGVAVAGGSLGGAASRASW